MCVYIINMNEYVQIHVYVYVLLPSLVIVSLSFATKPPKFGHIHLLRLKPAIFC